MGLFDYTVYFPLSQLYLLFGEIVFIVAIIPQIMVLHTLTLAYTVSCILVTINQSPDLTFEYI